MSRTALAGVDPDPRMPLCAAGGGRRSAGGGLFGCELAASARLNLNRPPAGVEAMLSHLLAFPAEKGWAAALVAAEPEAAADRKKTQRLVDSLDRLHRGRGKGPAQGRAGLQLQCRRALESHEAQPAGAVAYAALVSFFRRLPTPLVDAELMSRVAATLSRAAPRGLEDEHTRDAILLQKHAQLGLIRRGLCGALVERTLCFARDFSAKHAGGGTQSEAILRHLAQRLGPVLLRDAAPDSTSPPASAEVCAKAFVIMALHYDYIFGNEESPSGRSDRESPASARHHRVRSWIPLEPIDEHELSEPAVPPAALGALSAAAADTAAMPDPRSAGAEGRRGQRRPSSTAAMLAVAFAVCALGWQQTAHASSCSMHEVAATLAAARRHIYLVLDSWLLGVR